jgi:hypothetical protein
MAQILAGETGPGGQTLLASPNLIAKSGFSRHDQSWRAHHLVMVFTAVAAR